LTQKTSRALAAGERDRFSYTIAVYNDSDSNGNHGLARCRCLCRAGVRELRIAVLMDGK
jgi:hypothetical protein